MLIWTIAFLIFGLLAVLGYYQGAVRFLVSLVGLGIALMLAVPLGGVGAAMIVSLFGIKSIFWAAVLPTLIAFSFIYLISLIIAHFVHRKVALHYKYKADDITRLRWERLNEKLGLCLGASSGVVWILLLGLGIYVAGYPTTQLSLNDNATGGFRWLNMARHHLHSSGLDKTVARFDPMPPKYYEISDILGLFYQNPILLNRLGSYAPFLLLGESPELQDIANDKEFMDLVLSRGDIAQILQNPKTQSLIVFSSLKAVEMQPDLKDLRGYLETGKSKYDDEKILGRWSIDVPSAISLARRKNPDMSVVEMNQLKRAAVLLSGISFIATTDEKAYLRVQLSPQAQQLLNPTPPGGTPPTVTPNNPAPPPLQPAPQPGNRRGGGGRRGAGGGGGGGGGRGAAAATITTPATGTASQPTAPLRQQVFSAQGTWKNDAGIYQLRLQNERGQQENAEATLDGEKLMIRFQQRTLIFDKEA